MGRPTNDLTQLVADIRAATRRLVTDVHAARRLMQDVERATIEARRTVADPHVAGAPDRARGLEAANLQGVLT